MDKSKVFFFLLLILTLVYSCYTPRIFAHREFIHLHMSNSVLICLKIFGGGDVDGSGVVLVFHLHRCNSTPASFHNSRDHVKIIYIHTFLAAF